MKNPDLKQDIKYISILAVITLSIGIYLIATAVLISKDGVTFIEYAQNLEVSPRETISTEDQHPAYPAAISAVYRIFFSKDTSSSISNRIYSAQSVALFYRLCTVFILYFIGRQMFTARSVFVSVLILILLPAPAEYGSDALSDWPALFFIATGMLLLIYGSTQSKWWILAPAGLISGAGYLIRPECAQVVIYGSLWLILQFFHRKRTISRTKASLALLVLLAGFFVIAGPYMKLKGALFPKKHLGEFSSHTQIEINPPNQNLSLNASYNSEIIPTNILTAVYQLFKNIGEIFIWFFLPPLLIGSYYNFRQRIIFKPEMFFILVLIGLNIPLMIWLYCNYGYMSKRHTLVLAAFMVLFIPDGLKILSGWLEAKFTTKNQRPANWYLILILTGILICIPKLLRPMHHDKRIFREASNWLKHNSESDATIAVPDLRISFYAERKGLKYEDRNIPGQFEYLVAEPELELEVEKLKASLLISLKDEKNNRTLLIYKKVNSDDISR